MPESTNHQTSSSRRHPIFSGFLWGVILSGIVLFLIFWFYWRDPMPAVTPQILKTAREKWQNQGPSSYKIELEILSDGVQHYTVEVQQQKVVRLIHNGKQLLKKDQQIPKSWQQWSVPSMFDWIDDDFDRIQKLQKDSTEKIKMEAIFDEKYGFPKRYRLIVYNNNKSLEWKIIKFQETTSSAP